MSEITIEIRARDGLPEVRGAIIGKKRAVITRIPVAGYLVGYRDETALLPQEPIPLPHDLACYALKQMAKPGTKLLFKAEP